MSVSEMNRFINSETVQFATSGRKVTTSCNMAKSFQCIITVLSCFLLHRDSFGQILNKDVFGKDAEAQLSGVLLG